MFVQRAVRAESQDAPGRLVPLAACCKAALIAADTVGSARIKGKDSAAVWATRVLREGLSVDELNRIVDARLGDHAPYRFQEMVAASDERVTLVEAGCGNGKTLAAYMWARRHAAGRRLVFCYPTTGTTSAGFQDYLLAQTDLERALMHSRASADIEQILDNGETGDDRDSLWIADVLDLWGKKVVACTVDSVLSLLACWRRALAATPVFAQSAFVFDEVHSYDQHLFGAFLAFLRWTRAPCLVMTASLSDVRRAAIEQACGKALEPIRGEPTMEGAARYRIAQVGSEEVLGHVEEARTPWHGIGSRPSAQASAGCVPESKSWTSSRRSFVTCQTVTETEKTEKVASSQCRLLEARSRLIWRMATTGTAPYSRSRKKIVKK